MPDGGVIEGALISAAISTAASFAASTLIKPAQPKSPVGYPPNEITRGGYLPLVLGRRMVGCHVGWVGNRGSFSQHTAARSSTGTTTPSANQYLEGGWHQLCHGPVRTLYRIFQGSQVLFHTQLDATTTADGSTFQAGTANNPGKEGDNFRIRFGHDPLDAPAGSAPYQPVDPYLLAQAGLVSAYPGLGDIVWHRKLLGGSPSWPLMKYEIETRPDDVMAAAGLYDPFTPAGIPIYFPETTPASSDTRSVTVWLNGKQPIPAGTYTITYQNGAFKLNSGAGWQTYCPNVPNFFINVVGTGGAVATTTPYTDNQSIRPPNQYATQAEAEAANAGASKTFSWPGGPMGFEFGDITDFPGASPGIPNPTFSVQLTAGGPTYTASIAVQGGAAGSGDSGWNPAVSLYVLLCAPFPYGCGMAASLLDTTALLAVASTLAAERLVVNVLVENGQQADGAVTGLLSDLDMILPQIGGLLTPYLIRTEATVMSVPLDNVEGGLPEQQRQVSDFGGDRYTFQIDDVLNDFGTSDVTLDNDAQAFANNRPQAQTIKLASVTSRSVARQVGVRRAVNLVAQVHKVPAMTLLREARSPLFHPGRSFLLGGVQYRVAGWKVDTVGLSAEVDAYLDQYGDTSITYDPDNDDVNYSVPPAAPPEPDLFFNPLILPRSEWADPATPVFGVPRVRANESVNGAAVWLSATANGTYTQVGEQDTAQAGGVLLGAFSATPGVLAEGPGLSPYNDDITDVPDLSGDDASYAAGELTLVCEQEVMLLRSVTAQADGSYLLDDVTRGAFGTTVAAHAIGTPAVIVAREDLSPIPSALLAGAQGGTLWVKTQPTDGSTFVDLSLVTPEPLVVPLNLLATINVTAPTGGTVYVGQAVTITWQTTQLTGTLNLAYSTDGGVTWTTIAAGVADTGTYTWPTAGIPAAAAVVVRVSSTVTPTLYATSYPFALVTPVAPAAPTGLTATGGNTTAALTWTTPAGTPSPQLYRVKRGTASGGPYTTVATISVPAGETLPTTYVDAGLTDGTAYYWVVTAVANGAESAASNQATATPTEAVATGTGTGSGGGTSGNTTYDTYPAAVLAEESLVNFWRVMQATGSGVADVKGSLPLTLSATGATLAAATTTTDGDSGGGGWLVLDGETGYASNATAPACINTHSNWSIEFIVNVIGQSGNFTFMAMNDSAGNGVSLEQAYGTINVVNTGVSGGYQGGNQSFGDGTTHLVGVSYTAGGSVIGYLDGQPVNSANVPFATPTDGRIMYIGKKATGDNCNCRFAGIAVFSEALTASAFAAHQNAYVAGNA